MAVPNSGHVNMVTSCVDDLNALKGKRPKCSRVGHVNNPTSGASGLREGRL